METYPTAPRQELTPTGGNSRHPLRIALFTETFLPHVDGVVTRLTHTIKHLTNMGDEVLVVAPWQPGIPAAFAGARVFAVPSVPSVVYRDLRLGMPLTGHATKEALAAFRADIVHIADPHFVGLAGLSYARRHRIPLVASYHTHVPIYARRYHLGLLEGLAWRYVRAIHRRAAVTLCTSPSAASVLEEHGFQHVRQWKPGVDTELFTPDHRSEAWRKRLTGGAMCDTLLLVVGRLAVEKNLERLAPALAQVPGCHLALVGDGPAAPQLRREFAGLPVTFAGTLRGSDLAAAYASADILVQPSSTETLGLTVLEAMASGLPVVGARRGGIPNLIRDGETGLLFNPDVSGDLESAIRALIANDALRASMAQAGRTFALAQDWAATTARLRSEYFSVIHAHVI